MIAYHPVKIDNRWVYSNTQGHANDVLKVHLYPRVGSEGLMTNN
jgi:hypothetical protein